MNPRAQRLVEMVRLRKQLSIPTHIRRHVPRAIFPKPIQRAYAQDLLDIVAEVRVAFDPLLKQMPALLEVARIELHRLDAGESIHDMAEAIIASVQFEGPRAQRIAEKHGEAISTWQKGQLRRQVQSVLGIDPIIRDPSLGTRMAGFVAENVSLIKSLPVQLAFEVEQLLTRAIQSGMLWKDLAKELDARFKFGEDRAKLIARDQVGKFHGQLAATRQQEIGCVRFTWRTVRDNRVRPKHRQYEGKTFLYTKPPDGEMPGVPINCRCYPEPVFDEMLAALT